MGARRGSVYMAGRPFFLTAIPTFACLASSFGEGSSENLVGKGHAGKIGKEIREKTAPDAPMPMVRDPAAESLIPCRDIKFVKTIIAITPSRVVNLDRLGCVARGGEELNR